MNIYWLSVLAVAAMAIPVTLLLAITARGLRMAIARWKAKHSPVAYVSSSGDPLQIGSGPLWEADAKAQALLCRLFDTTPAAAQFGGKGLHVRGGATGHDYLIRPRCAYPIVDLTENVSYCAHPYNAHYLPTSDSMLTQALYLQCPETERAFRAVCNKANFAHVRV